MIEKILIFLNPSFWLMNDNYNHNWDKKLNSLLNSKDFTNIDKHTVTIGEYTVWISNYPYACFKCIGGPDVSICKSGWSSSYYSGRPSRYTIYSFKYIINIISSIHDKRTFTFTNILIHQLFPYLVNLKNIF